MLAILLEGHQIVVNNSFINGVNYSAISALFRNIVIKISSEEWKNTFIKFQISSSCEFLLFAILSAQNSWYCPFVMAVSNWLDLDTSSVSVTTWLTWTWWGTGCCGCSGLIDSNVISLPPNYNGKHKHPWDICWIILSKAFFCNHDKIQLGETLSPQSPFSENLHYTRIKDGCLRRDTSKIRLQKLFLKLDLNKW